MSIPLLLDIEKDLRDAEGCLSLGCRFLNCVMNEDWFECMEDEGFLVDGKFLPIVNIISKAYQSDATKRVFLLEAVACDLSLIAKEHMK